MPQKQKLSAEEKAKVIEDYINNRISLSEAARRGGVARDTISQWARNYEADGMTAFMTCRNRVYSPELKRQAVEDYLSGKGSQAELSKIDISAVVRRSNGKRLIELRRAESDDAQGTQAVDLIDPADVSGGENAPCFAL